MVLSWQAAPEKTRGMDELMPRPAVTVGIDDRHGSMATLRYALDEAGRLGLPLRLVHVIPADRGEAAWSSSRGASEEMPARAAVSVVVRSGSPIGGLVDEAAIPGTWMILGADHASGDRSSSGCVASGVIARAERPVTVVPPEWPGFTRTTRVFAATVASRGPRPELALAEDFARVRRLRLERVDLAADTGPPAAESAVLEMLEHVGRHDIVFIGRGDRDEPHPGMVATTAIVVRRAHCPVTVVPPNELLAAAG